jgi:hypothetical protein
MRDPITIGRYHSAPPRRVLRSLNSGYQGDWQSWAGTPRQMRRLASVAERDPESRFWWSHAFAACVGATLTLLVVLL